MPNSRYLGTPGEFLRNTDGQVQVRTIQSNCSQEVCFRFNCGASRHHGRAAFRNAPMVEAARRVVTFCQAMGFEKGVPLNAFLISKVLSRLNLDPHLIERCDFRRSVDLLLDRGVLIDCESGAVVDAGESNLCAFPERCCSVCFGGDDCRTVVIISSCQCCQSSHVAPCIGGRS